ncbi:MAG: hypothetical protein KAT17_10445 [Candidatus Aminicenantes bacterium]|nr:hypothetical protein [Candidatus Aminicenantes bacterium]
MERLDSVLGFSSFLLGLLILLVVFFFFYEKKKKKDIMEKFKTFSTKHTLSKENYRTVPRILIPESMEVILDLVRKNSRKIKAFAVDLSLTGISVESNFSLKETVQDMVLNNVRVTTPINIFFIKELRLVRKEQRVKKMFMAFYIKDIDEDQFEELKVFLKYLDEFLSHDDQKN